MPKSRNPIVEFDYEGETYEGKEVGLAMPREDSDEDWVKRIIISDEIEDNSVYIDRENINYNTNNTNRGSESSNQKKKTEEKSKSKNTTNSNEVDIMSRPGYSRNTDDGWTPFKKKDGVDEVTELDDLEKAGKPESTHKELKARLDVVKVAGVKFEGEKHYELYYHPPQMEA